MIFLPMFEEMRSRLSYRLIFSLLLILLLPFNGLAEILYSDINLSDYGDLVLRASISKSTTDEYETLISANPIDEKDGPWEFEILTLYPETITQQNRNIFYISNHFGYYRLDTSTNKIELLNQSFSFENQKLINRSEPIPYINSPLENYSLRLTESEDNPVTRADVTLVDRTGSTVIEREIAQDIQLFYRDDLIKWSPNEEYFIYEKDGRLYYYLLKMHHRDGIGLELSNKMASETYRIIGDGSINSVSTSNDSVLFYIKDREIFRIDDTDLFVYAFYRSAGWDQNLVGRLPFQFNPVTDSFSVSPDGTKMLLNQGNQSLYILELDEETPEARVDSLPALKLSEGTHLLESFWLEQNELYLRLDSAIPRDLDGLVYHYSETYAEGFRQVDSNIIDIDFWLDSGSEKAVCLYKDGQVVVRDLQQWRNLYSFYDNTLKQVYWRDSRNITLFGTQTISELDYLVDESRIISMSQPLSIIGFDQSNKIKTADSSIAYEYNSSTYEWTVSDDIYIRPAKTSSSQYRVFLQNESSCYYENSVWIRNISNYGTFPLLVPPANSFNVSGDTDFIDGNVFFHGSRAGRKEVALVFDCSQAGFGATDILLDLRKFDIGATFFLNGTFITRKPQLSKGIAESNFEMGSLYYTDSLLLEGIGYDTEYVVRGLAANEDLYYESTGYELTTLWHAPSYLVNHMVEEAGEVMNYNLVSRDIDPLDWTEIDSDLYRKSEEIVYNIINEVEPGSIITISLGSEINRDDWLYQYMVNIINWLLTEGYEIVTVGTLMEHSGWSE